MPNLLQTALLILLFNHPLQAQMGIGITGTSTIGTGNFPVLHFGKAATPNCITPGSCGRAPIMYTFKGAGDWNIEGNWEGNTIPPALLPARSKIVINPARNGECVLNIPMQIIPPGTAIRVMPGKRFRVSGKLVKY